jgi:hypothetical protein
LKNFSWSLSESGKAPGTNDARSGMMPLLGGEFMRRLPEAARVGVLVLVLRRMLEW